MRLRLTVDLPCDAGRAWAAERRIDLLDTVSRPFLTIAAIDPPADGLWREGTALAVAACLFGAIPLGRQRIAVARVDEAARLIETREAGPLIRRWIHVVRIDPVGPDRCRLTDDIDLAAGPLTPILWGLSRLFYRHRQRRRVMLLTERAAGR